MPEAPDTVARMTECAAAFLDALGADQRARAQLPFDDEAERRRWYYTPNERRGLPLGEMDSWQERAAMRLVEAGLSRPAYYVATTIMGLERALEAHEGWTDRRYPGRESHRFRDPGLYFVAVFGEPGASAWGWRFGGHHVSLSYTVVDGRLVSPTPTFFGSHPAELPLTSGSRPNVLRPLLYEEDLGRELVRALDAQQRGRAVIAAHAPTDLVLQNRPQVVDGALPEPAALMMGVPDSPGLREGDRRFRARLGLTEADDEGLRFTLRPKGLAAREMTPAQREVLEALVHQYVSRMPDDVAEAELRRLTPGVVGGLHFAWAGGLERREPHYYRIQGEGFLVEYDNTQDDVNHIHSVWRDPLGDFGEDLLAQHYAQAHAG